MSDERYRWAKMVVQTRAIRGADGLAVLCPVADLANHESVGESAAWQVERRACSRG